VTSFAELALDPCGDLQAEIERRTRRAYFRRFGEHAPMPSQDAHCFERDGKLFAFLYNRHSPLATYRITPKGDYDFHLTYVDMDLPDELLIPWQDD
jgi:hypothetical protein